MTWQPKQKCHYDFNKKLHLPTSVKILIFYKYVFQKKHPLGGGASGAGIREIPLVLYILINSITLWVINTENTLGFE